MQGWPGDWRCDLCGVYQSGWRRRCWHCLAEPREFTWWGVGGRHDEEDRGAAWQQNGWQGWEGGWQICTEEEEEEGWPDWQ